jgi:mycofactocin precursor
MAEARGLQKWRFSLTSDTVLQTSEVAIEEQTSIIENSDLEAPTDALELDLALEDELIIEDFTIDGICGVY